MHLRKLVLACGFASFALSNYASALGLGEVKLKSTLNQPLQAEVQLLDTRDLTAEQIIIALASPADFERNGVERLYFYTEFQFQVILDNPGGPVVRVTTRNPVREPYLNFLIEARWTAGRLLREYTLLMDLPTFDDAPKPAVRAAETVKPKAATSSSAKVNPPAQEVPASQSSAPEEKPDIIAEQDQAPKKSGAANGTYGPIGDKDTLWDIARAVRPDASVSVHQTMLALQRLNPDAFIKNNINLIKKGQVLRVPDSSEIASVSKADAVNQVNSQISEWSGTSTPSTGLGAQLDASRHVASGSRKAEPAAGRVKLEAPSASDAVGNGSGANKGAGKALEKELASALEELDKAKSEKTELSSRVHDLEDQVKTMQRLVDVSNEKLRALQLNAGKQPEAATAKPANETAVASSAAAVSSAAPVASSEATSSAEAASSAAAAVAATPVPTAAPKKAPAKPAVKPAPEKSLVDKLSDNLPWLGLGIVALAGAGYAVVRRRKSQAEEAAKVAESEDIFAEEPNFDAFSQISNTEPEPETQVDDLALFDEEDATAVAETGDVVGEADIYIAYGKFDQAEEMLLNGLAKNPDATDIRLKLLEVYSQTQNAREFDKHYVAILPLAAAFELNRAAELRTNIAGAGEFAGELPETPAGPDSLFNEDFHLDDDFTDEKPAQGAADDLSFDLDLADSPEEVKVATQRYDLDFNEKSADKAEASTSIPDDDFVLDFDLDDDLDQKPEAEDLSDISLALDGLDDDALAQDVQPAKLEPEEDFTFDFNEIEDTDSPLAQEVENIKTSHEHDVPGDDFNLEMNVDDVDLAALDQEMESLDADLDSLDAEEGAFEKLEADFDDIGAALDTETDLAESLDDGDIEFEPATDSVELDSDATVFDGSDFVLDESDIGELDIDGPDIDEPVIQEAVAEESVVEDAEDDLAWMDEELPLSDSAELDEEFASNELELDNDDFDIDSTEPNLDDLDAAFAGDELGIDDELAVIETEELPLFANDELVTEEVDELHEDDVFEQALSEFSADNLVMDETSDLSDEDLDAELDFADADEAATKLDLARAYIDMGDNDGARDILAEVAHEGNDQQRQEAADLLSRIDV